MALNRRHFLAGLGGLVAGLTARGAAGRRPNILLIYADDLGYGDVGCYGGRVPTPHCDRLAAEGLRFTNAHCAAATCTPSRFSLLTGEYSWRARGRGVLPGNAALIIEPDRLTLPRLLQRAGYRTGVSGKWHLGLGTGDLDWNGEIKPGPLELGFDTCFLIPATGDRVPCVYVKDHRVVGLDPDDPIRVSYGQPIGDEPTGRERPDRLKQLPSHGHDQTIVNGISRIGYMTGGQAARWIDEEMADTITAEAVRFIENHRAEPFFLYFSTHDIHVPRVPHPRFVGQSGRGPRGDAILQFDWCVGQLLQTLDRLGLTEDTIVIFTSDNGPVLDDGYRDQAVELLGDHRPAGPLRGGKYSAFDAGTRVPLVLRWPRRIKPGESSALVSQIDFLASFAALCDQPLAEADAPDSFNLLPAFLGERPTGREHLVKAGASLSLIRGDWKYIPPSNGPRVNQNTNIELGNDPRPQLYNLARDPGERTNVAAEEPTLVAELQALLEQLRSQSRSRP